MKYRDLFRFEPLETVIELRRANTVEAAKQYVKTYVVSPEMAEKFVHVVVPHLRFDQPFDTKGLFIVGNYGTGKSHLMAVVSALAEHAGLAAELREPAVAEAMKTIAGRFKVVRAEVGTTSMGLRDIVARCLEQAMEGWGIAFKFPGLDEVSGTKSTLEDMMGLFSRHFPDHGLLLAVDELLEYLRGRHDQELVRDLTFLRELGEAGKDLRFRFMAGVQESVFSDPALQNVSAVLLKAKDRFEQVYIARNDMKYVVAERLLAKDAGQLTAVRDYLAPFAKYYGDMNERMDEFVRLFPVHPDFINVFERIIFFEKRALLKTLSGFMRQWLDRPLPTDYPGVIAYDMYWPVLRDAPALKSIPEVGEVVAAGQVLEGRVNSSFTLPESKPLALRLVNALALQRLTTGRDVYLPVGATAEQLRDGLCLFDPLADLGGAPDEDLLGHVDTVLTEIRKTVSGSFLTRTPDTRQWYLDLKKVEDYDAQIERNAGHVGPERLDAAYFDALLKALRPRKEMTYVPGSRIYEYELEWTERRAARSGYLFFGAPNQRATAIPPRDFYLYFLPPHQAPKFDDPLRPDEVFFRLAAGDNDFHESLALYAAARQLAASASGEPKKIYLDKAKELLDKLAKWLNDHLAGHYDVTYQGKTQKPLTWLKGRPGAGTAFGEVVSAVGSVCLGACFSDQAPNYPVFSQYIEAEQRAGAAREAVKGIAGGGTFSRTAKVIADALGLLDGDRIDARRSEYAKALLAMLDRKVGGQVLNRSEIVQARDGVEYADLGGARLEPEWLSVVLAGLVHSGDVIVEVVGDRFDAGRLRELAAAPLETLSGFKSLKRPQDWNLPVLQALLELVGEPAGLASMFLQNPDLPTQKLVAGAQKRATDIAAALQSLSAGLMAWQRPIWPEEGLAAKRRQLETAKGFFETLAGFNTPGKLKNLKTTADDISAPRAALETWKEIVATRELLDELRPAMAYLAAAEPVLPESHPWVADMRKAREELTRELLDPNARAQPAFAANAVRRLDELGNQYRAEYMALHLRERLDARGEERKRDLRQDPRYAALNGLTSVSILPLGQLTAWQNKYSRLVSCVSLTELDLMAGAICPHCHFTPAGEAANGEKTVDASARSRLDQLAAELDTLYEGWTKILLSYLADPAMEATLKLLSAADRDMLKQFVADGRLPEPVTDTFARALGAAMKGLQKASLRLRDMNAVLVGDGAAVTPEELRRRFEAYLKEITKGQEPDRVRIVLE